MQRAWQQQQQQQQRPHGTETAAILGLCEDRSAAGENQQTDTVSLATGMS
jgi:hypothetical protein